MPSIVLPHLFVIIVFCLENKYDVHDDDDDDDDDAVTTLAGRKDVSITSTARGKHGTRICGNGLSADGTWLSGGNFSSAVLTGQL